MRCEYIVHFLVSSPWARMRKRFTSVKRASASEEVSTIRSFQASRAGREPRDSERRLLERGVSDRHLTIVIALSTAPRNTLRLARITVRRADISPLTPNPHPHAETALLQVDVLRLPWCAAYGFRTLDPANRDLRILLHPEDDCSQFRS